MTILHYKHKWKKQFQWNFKLIIFCLYTHFKSFWDFIILFSISFLFANCDEFCDLQKLFISKMKIFFFLFRKWNVNCGFFLCVILESFTKIRNEYIYENDVCKFEEKNKKYKIDVDCNTPKHDNVSTSTEMLFVQFVTKRTVFFEYKHTNEVWMYFGEWLFECIYSVQAWRLFHFHESSSSLSLSLSVLLCLYHVTCTSIRLLYWHTHTHLSMCVCWMLYTVCLYKTIL